MGMTSLPTKRLKILHVNTVEIAGGAAAITRQLQEGYRKRGHQNWIIVADKQTQAEHVLKMNSDKYRSRWARACITAAELLNPIRGKFPGPGRLYTWLRLGLGEPKRYLSILRGLEDFDYPATWRLLELAPDAPDIFHLHNLHGDFFDLRVLPYLSQRFPVFMTLHDPWLLTGHCAHSFGCERWRIGCGECPDLSLYPAVRRDATAFNWKRKAKIFSQSKLYVATPSQWLMNQVEASMLAPGIVEAQVIPNGVNLSIFHPADRQAVRRMLNIPSDAKVVLFAAAGGRLNPFKGYKTLHAAILRVSRISTISNLIVLCVGELLSGNNKLLVEQIGRIQLRYVAFEKEAGLMARYYQAADVYAHSAKVDNFPTTVLESMACATPVVATNVGGLPEQIIHGENGFLAPTGDSESFAKLILTLLENEAMRRTFGENAADTAATAFSSDRMIQRYLDWYLNVLAHTTQFHGSENPTTLSANYV